MTKQYNVIDESGREYSGSAEEIVRRMRAMSFAPPTHDELGWMIEYAERAYTQTQVDIDTSSADAFIQGMMEAGLLKPKQD